jgi:hypothetical protein
MKKVLDSLNKGLMYVLYIICIMSVFTTCNSCKNNRIQEEQVKENVILRQEIDSLTMEFNNRTITLEEMELMLDENGYEFLIFEDNLDKSKVSLGTIKIELDNIKKQRKDDK